MRLRQHGVGVDNDAEILGLVDRHAGNSHSQRDNQPAEADYHANIISHLKTPVFVGIHITAQKAARFQMLTHYGDFSCLAYFGKLRGFPVFRGQASFY